MTAITVSTSWVILFIDRDHLSEKTIDFLDSRCYPLEDTDRDTIYDIRGGFLEDGKTAQLKQLLKICTEHRAGYIKLIDQSNY